jgi:hypothetical protein
MFLSFSMGSLSLMVELMYEKGRKKYFKDSKRKETSSRQ